MSEYNVYYHEINGDKIKTFNVLRENGYVMDCIRGYKKDMSKEEFDKELNADSDEYVAHFNAGCGMAVDLISGEKVDFGGGTHLPAYSAYFWKCEY